MATSLAANALTSLDEAKLFIKNFGTADDALVRSLINMASARIESYCDRKFIVPASDYVEYYDGQRTRRIQLKQWPVVSITEVAVDCDHEFSASSVIPASGYDIDFDQRNEGIGIVRYDCEFPRGVRNVKITYSAGYTSPSADINLSNLPPDLIGACNYLVQYYYKIQQEQDVRVASESKGDETVGLLSDIPAFITSILDNYSRMEFLGFEAPIQNL